MKRIVHPVCEPDCAHTPAKPNGEYVQHAITGDRDEIEAGLRATHESVVYLGILGPGRGDDKCEMHTWLVDGELPALLPARSRDEGRAGTREIKYEYRPAVWTGDGRPPSIDSLFNQTHTDPERVVFPTPEHTSEMPLPGPAPQPVAALVLYATLLHWDCVTTYAKGNPPHAGHGRPTAVRESWAIRMTRGTERAVAVRMGNTWSSFWYWSPTTFFRRSPGLDKFKAGIA